jgi:hypothetical protein
MPHNLVARSFDGLLGESQGVVLSAKCGKHSPLIQDSQQDYVLSKYSVTQRFLEDVRPKDKANQF